MTMMVNEQHLLFIYTREEHYLCISNAVITLSFPYLLSQSRPGPQGPPPGGRFAGPPGPGGPGNFNQGPGGMGGPGGNMFPKMQGPGPMGPGGPNPNMRGGDRRDPNRREDFDAKRMRRF